MNLGISEINFEMNTIYLVKTNAKEMAQEALADLRTGKDVTLNCIEVIDELLQIATPEDRDRFEIWAGSKHFSWDMAKRLRFERGLDIRY